MKNNNTKMNEYQVWLGSYVVRSSRLKQLENF